MKSSFERERDILIFRFLSLVNRRNRIGETGGSADAVDTTRPARGVASRSRGFIADICIRVSRVDVFNLLSLLLCPGYARRRPTSRTASRRRRLVPAWCRCGAKVRPLLESTLASESRERENVTSIPDRFALLSRSYR